MNATILVRVGVIVFAGLTAGWSATPAASPALRIELTQDREFGKYVDVWVPSLASPFHMVSTLETKKILLRETGTAWATELHGKPILVTAGHVIGTFGERVLDAKSQASLTGFHRTRQESTVVLGGIGGTPKEIGILKADSDIALIVPGSGAVFSGLRIYPLANRLPALFESVRAIGFPLNAEFAKQENSTVMSVMGKAGFFVLNDALKPGFSGGVVIDADGRALGVITSVDKSSTTVLALDRTLLEQFKFDEAKRVLTK
jgi:hypothetical protein